MARIWRLAHEQGVAEVLHQFVKPRRTGTLDPTITGGSVRLKLSTASPRGGLLLTLAVGMKDGDLRSRVQITSHDGHGGRPPG